MSHIRSVKVGGGGLLSKIQQTAHAHIKDDIMRRNEGYNIMVTKDFPLLDNISGKVFLGSFSWTDVTNKRRWIKPQHALILPGTDTIVTAPQIARSYIRFKMLGKRLRMRSAQAEYCIDNKKSVPLYCTPCVLEDAVYVDIKSAYWSIMRIVGLTPEYMPHRFLSKRITVDDFPYPAEKLVRNVIVSSGLKTKTSVWQNGKIKLVSIGGGYVNLMLWAVCMDILNTFARDMISVGAVYVHTDGYIFQKRDVDLAISVAKAWGLPISIKYQGRANVWGVAAYEFIGSVNTRWRRSNWRYTSKIQAVEGDWLRKRVLIFSNDAGMNHGMVK